MALKTAYLWFVDTFAVLSGLIYGAMKHRIRNAPEIPVLSNLKKEAQQFRYTMLSHNRHHPHIKTAY